MNTCYSILIYEREANKSTYENIMSYISKGTKVYYLTESCIEEFKDMSEQMQINRLEKLKRDYLLSMNYDISLSMQFGDYLRFEDGKISDNIRSELLQENFNLEQYDIEHLDQNLHIIVKAGAGTGKTKTMIDRSIFLRHKGYSSFRNMIMITFTNKAAIQMKNKLSERLEAYYEITHNYEYLKWLDELSDMRIQTIHSFAKEFIEKFGDIIEIDRNSKIKSLKYEKYKIVEELVDKYRVIYKDNYYKFRYIPQYKLIKAILYIENYIMVRGIDIIHEEEKLEWGIDDSNFNHLLSYLLLNLCKEVKEFKEKNRYIELNDLVITLKEFVDQGKIINKINTKYIMVDEFQDTDTTQVQFLIWFITNSNCKSFVVGDLKQSIYRFRGADYTAFSQYEEELVKQNGLKFMVKKTLRKNYRSDSRIIDKLNKFFQQILNSKENEEEIKHFTFNDDDKLEGMLKNNTNERVIKYFSQDENSIKDDDMEYIINLVKKNDVRNSKLTDREKIEDIAVLVRINRDLEYIVNKLEINGIQCKKEVSGSFYRSIAVREFYIMLKALLYPKVCMNQYAFINSSYGFGIDNNEVLDKFDVNSNYLHKIIETRDEYTKLEEYRNKIKIKPFMQVLNELVEYFEPHINFGIKKLRDIPYINKEEAIRKIRTSSTNYEMNLMHLFTILDANFSNIESNILDVEEFLRIMIQTNNIEDEKMLSFHDGKYDLTCMTVHKAKGLEFDHIVLPKTSNKFLHKSNNVNVFLTNNNKGKIEIAYSVDFDEFEVKNSIYTKNINKENSEIIAEEIRLLYVALTRAKKSIHINKSKIISNTGCMRSWMELLERGKLRDE